MTYANAPGTLGIPRYGITRCEVKERDVFKSLHSPLSSIFFSGVNGSAPASAKPCRSPAWIVVF